MPTLINLHKRNTLKTLSAGAMTAAVPLAVTQSAFAVSRGPMQDTHHEGLQGLVLTFEGTSTAGTQSVSLRTTGTESVALQHVYPGIIGIGEDIFDINQLFKKGTVVVRPGDVIESQLTAITQGACECGVPPTLTTGAPLHVIAAPGFSSRVIKTYLA